VLCGNHPEVNFMICGITHTNFFSFQGVQTASVVSIIEMLGYSELNCDSLQVVIDKHNNRVMDETGQRVN